VDYRIEYYSEGVEKEILALPDTLAARYIVLTRRMTAVGANLQKSPLRELEVARKRMKEVKDANS